MHSKTTGGLAKARRRKAPTARPREAAAVEAANHGEAWVEDNGGRKKKKKKHRHKNNKDRQRDNDED